MPVSVDSGGAETLGTREAAVGRQDPGVVAGSHEQEVSGVDTEGCTPDPCCHLSAAWGE